MTAEVQTLTAAGFTLSCPMMGSYEKVLPDGRVVIAGTANGGWGADVYPDMDAYEAGETRGVDVYPQGTREYWDDLADLLTELRAAGVPV